MRFNIHKKITIFFILTNAAVLLSLFFYLSGNLKDYTYKRIKTNVFKQITLSRTYLSHIPLKGTLSYSLDEVADKIGDDLGLRVTIMGLDGTVYGDSEIQIEKLGEMENHLYRPEVQNAIKDGFGESRRFSTTIKEDFLYMAALFNNNGTSGVIRLSITLSEIDQLLGRLRKILVFALLAAFGLSVLVSYLVSCYISRPIREISWAAQNVAHGNFHKKIFIRSNDELGDLAKAFNYMSKQVQNNISKISESRSRLEAVFLSMFEGVMVVDMSGSVVLVNQALKNFLKIEDEPVGRRFMEVIRNIQIQEIIDKVLTSCDELISAEISTLVPEEKILLVHATAIKKSGQAHGAVLVFHDVTELRHLEKVRRDFVANVSHELRTPVSSIKGYSETLLSGALEDEAHARDFLSIILSDSNRLASLIDDLLNLSKIESGNLIMEFKPQKLRPIIAKVFSGLKKQIDDKGISVEIDFPSDMPDVLIDHDRISQVLLNLMDNAMKYNSQNGKIIVKVFARGSFVGVDISDTGIGIPEKDLPRIFERFYRVDKARSRELGGTGLGLSIVKHIVQAHGGEVSVHSVEGQGTTFSFTLPKA
ncbi:MAG: ATP-binding protein [Candidatus Omnitrophica bacterium]|nr:ATP-binding protein [Candidatus Omnitrophota bacterium]